MENKMATTGDSQFLTIREAVDLTGRSLSTIRRLVAELKRENKENTLFKVDSHNGQFYYKVSRVEVFKHWPEVKKDPSPTPHMNSGQKEAEGSHSLPNDHSPTQMEASLNPKSPKKQGSHQGVGECLAYPSIAPTSFINIIVKQIKEKDAQLQSKDKIIGHLITKSEKQEGQFLERLREANILVRDLQKQLLLASGFESQTIPNEKQPEQGSEPKKKKGFWASVRDNKISMN